MRFNPFVFVLLLFLAVACGGLDAVQKTNYPIMVGKMATPTQSFDDIKSKYSGEIKVTSSKTVQSTQVSPSQIYSRSTTRYGIESFAKNLERLQAITRVNYFYQYVGLSDYNFTYWIDVYEGGNK